MGYIYVIRNESLEYKIGYTGKKPKQRLKELQTGNPSKLEVVIEYETKYGIKLEKTVQRFYKYRLIRGEWYKLTDSDLKEFVERCKKFENGLSALNKNFSEEEF